MEHRVEKQDGRVRAAFRAAFVTVACLSGATVLGMIFRGLRFPDTNVVVVYIFSVLLTARFVPGYGVGVAASIAATLTFNYFFTEPYYTLNVYDLSYLITFAVMTVTAFVTSAVTARAQRSEARAWERERATTALYKLAHRLTDAADLRSISGAVAEEASAALGCNAACLCFSEEGKPFEHYLQWRDVTLAERRTNAADLRKYASPEAVFDGGCSSGQEFCDWPVKGEKRVLGVIRLPVEQAAHLSGNRKDILRAMAENTALAMDRVWNERETSRSREEISKEGGRGGLLRAVTQDLGAPLQEIMALSEQLRQALNCPGQERSAHFSKEQGETQQLEEQSNSVRRAETQDGSAAAEASGAADRAQACALADVIRRNAEWALTMVDNILDLTRLQDGRLRLDIRPEPVEAVVNSAMAHIAAHYPARRVEVKLPNELLMVPMDARLITQVLVNLLDNAIKHTEPGQEVSLTVGISRAVEAPSARIRDIREPEKGAGTAQRGGYAVFTVRDSGPGIGKQDLPKLFRLFYTGQENTRKGAGLGLAVCDAVVRLHRGTIAARNRSDARGAEFVFMLPLKL